MRKYEESPSDIARRAAATRRRRAEAGRYPTRHQKAAFNKYLQGNGRQHLSAEECALLGTHPGLTASQRDEFSNMAIAKGW